MKMPIAARMLTLILGMLAAAPAAQAATLVVTSLADDGGPGTLRAAISTANTAAGDTITFQSGLTGTILLTGSLPNITVSMTIQGPGARYLAVDGAHSYRPLYVHNAGTAVTISGLTIQNGYSIFNGGGILNVGELTLNRCTLAGNQTIGNGNGGGALFSASGGSAALNGCTLTNNTAGYEGGGVFSAGTATLTHCTLSGNSALDGGAVCSYGIANVSNCTLSGNSATSYGGAIFNISYDGPTAGLFTITNSSLTGNTAANAGCINNEEGTLTVVASTLSANSATAGAGGCLYNDNGTATFANCTLAGNSSTAVGGAIFESTDGTLGLTNCTCTGNDKGGVYVQLGATTFANCVLYGETGGPEISRSAGVSVTATNCDIQGGLTGTGIADGGGNINADPLFAPAGLAVNGGPTATIALGSGSPCLGAGASSGAPNSDQRGYARPNPPSIGAYDIGSVTALHTFAAGVTMFSMPTDYTGGSLSQILGYSPTLAVWDPTIVPDYKYVVTPSGLAGSIIPGQAYWVRFPAAKTVTYPGQPNVSPFTFQLAPGWNMIGCPSQSPVALSAVTVTDSDNVTHSFAAATAGGLINDPLYTFQPGDIAYEIVHGASGSLQPYFGYWIYAFHTCTLNFP